MTLRNTGNYDPDAVLVSSPRAEWYVAARARPRSRSHHLHVRADIQHHRASGPERPRERRLYLIRVFDPDANAPQTFGELDQIRPLKELPHLEALVLLATVRRLEGSLILAQGEVVVDQDDGV